MLCSLLIWHVPSLLTVISFSFFAYFLAKLNMEIESANQRKDQEVALRRSRRQKEAGGVSGGTAGMTTRRNVVVPSFFVFFNLLAMVTYIIIVFSCKDMMCVISFS
jgi:phage shock protein PspC (stress-responsive transcriptional regulator)